MPRPPQIAPLGHDMSTWLRILVHSEPGVGKTIFAATSPKALILLADPNAQSAVLYGTTADRWNIQNWTDMEEALMYLSHEGYKEYEWVWLDSVTHFQELGLDGIMEELVKQKSHRLKWAADRGEYGQNMSRLGMWCRDMIRVPVNFGITSHTMKDDIELDDGTVETLWVPAIQGRNMPAKICSYMNLVGFMYSRRVANGEISVEMLTDKDASHYAKDNWMRALGGHMAAPTIPKVTAAIDRKRAILAARKAPGSAGPVKKATKAVAPTKKTAR